MKSYITELFFMLLALVLVIALAWLILRALSWMQTNKQKNQQLAVKLTLPVGSRERIMVLQYKDSEYVLGVTASSINLLDKLPAPIDDKPATQPVASQLERTDDQ